MKYNFDDEFSKLSEENKEILTHIQKSWELEGYKLTEEDKISLIKMCKKESTADEEIEKLLKKYRGTK